MTLLDSVGRKTAAVEAMASRLGLADRVAVRTEFGPTKMSFHTSVIIQL